MSKEQDNQMEQWLEEYAQRRRNELDEPIEMHEATRTMLQGEVSRVYTNPVATQPEPKGSSAWLAWAIGGATVGVAAIVITLNSNLPQDPDPMKMALAAEEKQTASVGEQEPTGTTETVVAKAKEQENPAVRRIASVAGESVPGSAPREVPAVTTSNHTTPEAKVAGGFAPRKVNVQKRDATFYKDIRELRQDFAQSNLPVANRKNVLPEAVLVDFQVERTGNQVRVIDQDGSVYTGNVINEEQYSSVTEDKAVRRRRPRAASSGQFYFRVQGLNRTLGKAVVLEATLDSPPDKLIEADKLTTLKSKDRAKEDEGLKAAEGKKELSVQNMQIIRAIARMRVLGNARIEKANYAVDAYLQQPALPAKVMIKPSQTREK